MQSFHCNFCLKPLELFSEWPSSDSTPSAYLSECLRHIFCAPCKTKIYPKCVCRPRSRFLAINKRMPERFLSMFQPPDDIFERLRRIGEFQAKQNQANFERMSQYYQRAKETIEQIDQHDAIKQTEFHKYLERCKKMKYLIEKRPKQRKSRKKRTARRRRPSPVAPPNYGQKKFIFQPSLYRNVKPVSPRQFAYSRLNVTNAHYNAQQSEDSGFNC